MSNIYRQGDVMLKKVIERPNIEGKQYYSMEGNEEENTIILAFGESTGHKHAIYNCNGNVMLVKEKDSNRFYLMILKEEVSLQHEEHTEITLPVGNYEVTRQCEYTPQEIINVAD